MMRYDQFPESWHNWTQYAYDFVSWNLSLFDRVDPGKCTFWMVETGKNSLIGHKASSWDIE